jgi:hypothetical protein
MYNVFLKTIRFMRMRVVVSEALAAVKQACEGEWRTG